MKHSVRFRYTEKEVAINGLRLTIIEGPTDLLPIGE
jgi:hypothetical protein